MTQCPISHRTVRYADVAMSMPVGHLHLPIPIRQAIRLRRLLHHSLNAPVPTSSLTVDINAIRRRRPCFRIRILPRLLLLELPIRLRLRHDITEKLQIIDP